MQPRYSSAHNLSIEAHALTCLPNVRPFGPSLPQPPNLTSLWKLLYSRILLQLFEGVGGGGFPSNMYTRTEPGFYLDYFKTAGKSLNVIKIFEQYFNLQNQMDFTLCWKFSICDYLFLYILLSIQDFTPLYRHSEGFLLKNASAVHQSSTLKIDNLFTLEGVTPSDRQTSNRQDKCP